VKELDKGKEALEVVKRNQGGARFFLSVGRDLANFHRGRNRLGLEESGLKAEVIHLRAINLMLSRQRRLLNTGRCTLT